MASKVAIQRSRVVIIGAGFGGLSAAKALTGGPFDVTLVDRYNYHLFQPLLYQVATAALSPADIAWPIRTVFRRQLNVNVVLANVSGIDAARNEVIAEGAPHPVQLPDRRNRRAASLSVSASPPPSSCGLLLRSSSALGALRMV